MPIIKSAKKRVKVTQAKQDRNYQRRSRVKRAIKSATENARSIELKASGTLDAKKAKNLKDVSPEELDKSLRLAHREIDMAAKKGILHKNTAARRKAKVAKAIAKVKA